MDRRPLSEIFYAFYPQGTTQPGYLPTARIGDWTVISQQHEALHHEFNSLTTIGNCLGLLNQLSAKCSLPLAQQARRVAQAWLDAQERRLEGIICYVSFQRGKRRLSGLTADVYERGLTKIYRELWLPIHERYESFSLRDDSKDALALHVATFCLNIPVYEHIHDISHFDEAINAVTENIVDDRFATLERALLSDKGQLLLRDWEHAVIQAWGTLDEKHACDKEATSVDEIFHELMPNIPYVARSRVPYESLALAAAWNEQLGRLPYSPSCRIEITFNSFVTAMEQVTLLPPSPCITGLYETNNPAPVLDILRSDSQLCCLAIFHRDAQGWCFSNKYNRRVSANEVYVRFMFCRADISAEHCDFLDHNLFSVFSLDALPTWIHQLAHPHLVLTQSSVSDEFFDAFTQFSSIPAEQRWRLHWATPTYRILHEIILSLDVTERLQTVLMTVSKSAFFFRKLRNCEWVDVYPVPWDLRYSLPPIAATAASPFEETLDPVLLFGALVAVVQTSF